MTARRYFYTDLLAASWMIKCFGMRFSDEPIRVTMHGWEVRHDYKENRYYIHPDSLHLLAPRGGDLTEAGIWRALDKVVAPANNRIIQRNGVAFMWPESEEA